MFIHGSTKSLGSISNSVKEVDDHVSITGCTPACGSNDEGGDFFGLSTFCDIAKCSSNYEIVGFGCGAGNPSKFGPACRLCLNESHALEEPAKDHSGLPQKIASLESNVHMPMCNIKLLEAVACTQQCSDNIDTVRSYGMFYFLLFYYVIFRVLLSPSLGANYKENSYCKNRDNDTFES